jgi:Bifunctional DNA primase/polymerase, N-terminal/Primase C terminal 2 (PriCT-2)
MMLEDIPIEAFDSGATPTTDAPIVCIPMPLRMAVQAAIDAYTTSGRILHAALAYAAHGYPVFPLSKRTKAPIPKADRDAHNKKIPKTGGFYKATTDPVIINQWWHQNEHLIGMPMGPASNVFAIDVDTDEDHADGMAEWDRITAEHGAIKTREHLTATGGLHLILKYDNDQPIGCSRGSLPDGIDVKGRGGYIVMPPSRRKDREYRVGLDIDPIDPPRWLIEMIRTRPVPLFEARQRDGADYVRAAGLADVANGTGAAVLAAADIAPDLAELAEAMSYIPNRNLPWDEWTVLGLALFAATQGRGLPIFDQFSKRSAKYDQAKTLERWEQICGSPPDRIGARHIFHRAAAHGWTPKTSPTYPAAGFSDLGSARREVKRIADEFLCLDGLTKNVFLLYAVSVGIERTPEVWAIRVDTGVGKTRIMVGQIAMSGRGGIIYGVPTHKLGSDIERQFSDYGVAAQVFRGRSADDPEQVGSKMCLNLASVELALKCQADVARTCCEKNGRYCHFYNQCGYQRQQAADPRVWIVAADMVFHRQAAFGKPRALIIDESFWQKALRGTDGGDDSLLAFASLATGNQGRRDLAAELQMQIDDGGLQRSVIEHMNIVALRRMIRVEWATMPKLSLRPGMPPDEFDRLRKNGKLIEKIAYARRVIQILEELCHMLEHPEISVSGRLLIDERNGLRGIRWRGIDTIGKQFQIPTLLLDATLPDLAVLQVLHPQAEIVADVRVALPPGVYIRQVLNAPTSSRKLIETSRLKDRDQHLNSVRRYILRRWIETGKQSTLVICQMKVEKWLEGKLPDGILLAHYNAIAGLDQFKDVRLLILIGRPQPGPDAVETIAAMLNGSMPDTVADGSDGFSWYSQVRRGIRQKDGSGVAVDGDQHPDPFAESVRKLITEAELVQALGRARAVNRSLQAPLDVEMLFDTVLPVTVDEVSPWIVPSLLIETAAEGVMLLSPVDLVKIWPALWPNDKAADRTIAMGVPALPGFDLITYQLDGPKMTRRTAYFDRKIIPDPLAWLAARLGPLRDLSL